MTVLGLDSCRRGWVVVAASDLGVEDIFVAPDAPAAERIARERWDVEAIVIDIPIGIPDTGPRQADSLARTFIRPRSSSVFSTPVRSALFAADYDQARANSIAATGGSSLSKQAWAIGTKIREIDAWAPQASVPVREGHPEVSFRAMAASGIEFYKKSETGIRIRRGLLEDHGLVVPEGAERGLVGTAVDDVLDAGAMAWTALRVARGEAVSLPGEPEVFSDGWQSAIWF